MKRTRPWSTMVVATCLAAGSQFAAHSPVGAQFAPSARTFPTLYDEDIYETVEDDEGPSLDESAQMSADGESVAMDQGPITERRKRLRAMNYDRRPSAILKAWAAPNEKDDSQPDDADDASVPGGVEEAAAIPAGVIPPVAFPPGAIPATSVITTATGQVIVGTSYSGPVPSGAMPIAMPPGATLPPEILERLQKARAMAAAQQQAPPLSKAELKALQRELKTLARDVTLGRWSEVKVYLKGIPADEAADGYLRMLQSLTNPQPSPEERTRMPIQPGNAGQMMERNVFQWDDLIGLATACPFEMRTDRAKEKLALAPLGLILRQTIQSGTVLAEVVARMKQQIALPPEAAVLTSRQCALLLKATGNAAEAAPFLPPLVEAVKENDAEAANLLARCLMAQHAKEKQAELLEDAWRAVQASLAMNDPDRPGIRKPAIEKPAAEKPDVEKPAADAASQEKADEAKADDKKSVPRPATPDRAVLDKAALDKAAAERVAAETAKRATAEASKRRERFKLEREEALRMAVELAPSIRKEFGQTWLEESFTRDPQRGMNILATIGATASTAIQRQPHQPEDRLKVLELQKTAVESLLANSPEQANQWQDALVVISGLWLREATLSQERSASTAYGPRMQRDRFGNIFFSNNGDDSYNHWRNSNQPSPIAVDKMLEVGPSDAWIAQLTESVRPKYFAAYARLYLKVGEEERSYPYIERLAPTHPSLARDLAHEFIRLWSQSHDPNSENRYQNPYIFMFGFEQKAQSIPLTRSKQQRNLVELAEWIRKIRGLPIKDLDESLFAQAFTNCHSSAEVYQLASIEKVFGSVAALEAKTLAQLAMQMRQNLAGVWRVPAVQENNKTRRKSKDIEAEVLRGYEVAHVVVDGGLKKYPDDWQLHLALACLAHDELCYRQEVAPDSKFSQRRIDAIAGFQRAAELYARLAPTLRTEEQTSLAFEHWFYAGLGASDLNQIDHRSTPDERQPALIRKAISELPGPAAGHHLGLFANALFTRMSALKPTVKFRYLKAGFEIVGDHPHAREAHRLYDYYKDLVTEIKLVTRIDGPAKVGHDEPFGVFVDLHHTHEIERESGGFGRYLQNQSSTMYFAYNYGRPTENYRDKFQEAITAALAEQFEVKSVTFQADTVNSRASKEYGWRDTPYAYLLLKARGPQVDKLPALKIDLDFLDTSGYVILPFQSPAVPLVAAQGATDDRPFQKLQITQTLDERQAAEGKLVLEIKAVARGIVPPLASMLPTKFENFELVKTEDHGVSVSRFDPDSSEPAVLTERTWLLTLSGRKDLAELPTSFKFPAPKVEGAEVVYQRYADADLASVGQVVSLERRYGDVRRTWLLVLAAAVPLGIALVVGSVAWARRRKQVAPSRFAMPEAVTPFSVIALLRNIEHNNGLAPDTRQELAASIANLESHYFADTNGTPREQSPVDLKSVAETWLARAK